MATVILADSGVQLFDPAEGSDWDVAFIAGQQLPGLVKVSVSTERKIDVANGPGQISAQIRFQGVSPAELSVEITTWTIEQMSQLEAMLRDKVPAPSKKPPQPFPFSHPASSAAGVSAIVIEKVDWYKNGPAPQSKTTTLACKQWLPPRKAPLGVPTLNAPTVAQTETPQAPSLPSGGNKSQPS